MLEEHIRKMSLQGADKEDCTCDGWPHAPWCAIAVLTLQRIEERREGIDKVTEMLNVT